jgi:hypothetical protein
MNCCGTDQTPVCPCGGFAFPRVITNPPGLTTLAYRAGDYAGFRHALLLPRPGETALTRAGPDGVTQVWRPGAEGDLAVQLVEWWAYLADVLTFYNERAANQAYLRTADLPESVNRLIRLLGYRPRAGIGATGTLAALAVGPDPFTLPAGFQVQSKPGPGQQPQIFELTIDVTITPPIDVPGTPAVQGSADVSPVTPAPSGSLSAGGSLVLAGSTSAVKAGDRLLILPTGKPASSSDFGVATAGTVTHGKDALGSPITTVALAAVDKALTDVDLTQYQLLTSASFAQVWPYPAADKDVVLLTGTALQVDLVSAVRSIKAGDAIVFEFLGGSNPPQYGTVTKTTESVWYANPAGYVPGSTDYSHANPAIPPPWPPPSASAPNPAPVAIAIPHTRITFGCQLTGQPTDTMASRPNFLVRYGWKAVGNLTVPPSKPTVGGPAPGDAPGGPLSLQQPAGATPFPVPTGTTILVKDALGHGAFAVVDGPSALHVPAPAPALVPPLRALFNLLPVTRGKTVPNEVLGSGNSLVAGQDFMLQQSPVTYLQSADSRSGDGYGSTVRVWVNGQEWAEVPSFYGQPPGARVFVTREDDQGKTHVVFGDGQNGARPPTGVNNIMASYRTGSGAAAPAAGSLTVVLKPVPGLRGVRNPVAVGGGADPDPPSKVRRLAPRSVLTFGRAVSVDDFQAIAAQAPGVVRATAAVAFDPLAQRPRVTVWVGDDSNAVGAARTALAGAADPNRLPRVLLASAVVMKLSLTVVTDPTYHPQPVKDAVHAALLDPDAGLLGANVVGIGEAFHDSQVYATCLAVPGVMAVHSLRFAPVPRFVPLRFGRGTLGRPVSGPATVAPAGCSGERHDPGEGGYLSVPDDADHFTLGQETAS